MVSLGWNGLTGALSWLGRAFQDSDGVFSRVGGRDGGFLELSEIKVRLSFLHKEYNPAAAEHEKLVVGNGPTLVF